MLEPIVNFSSHPFGAGRLRRCEQQKIFRLAQGCLDRSPESGTDGEIGVVAENADRPRPVPRLCKPPQRRLERRRQLPISCMAVRDESFVTHVTAVLLALILRFSIFA
jgi:hypothetical protein